MTCEHEYGAAMPADVERLEGRIHYLETTLAEALKRIKELQEYLYPENELDREKFPCPRNREDCTSDHLCIPCLQDIEDYDAIHERERELGLRK